MNWLVLLAQAQPAPAVTNTITTNTWNWADLVSVHFEKGELLFSFGPISIALIVLCSLGFIFWTRRLRGGLRRYDVVKYTLKAANIGEIEVVPNTDSVRIAYQAWVELKTRKVALPFDEKNDVIVEIYDSYYQVFSRLRDLAKTVPAHRLRDSKDLRELVEIMIKVLNEGLRPHLTVWQAKFRRWYDAALKRDADVGHTPQEIQRGYAEYAALVADLKKVHEETVDYAEFLRRVAEGGDERRESETPEAKGALR